MIAGNMVAVAKVAVPGAVPVVMLEVLVLLLWRRFVVVVADAEVVADYSYYTDVCTVLFDIHAVGVVVVVVENL